jgi:hypothetical protein
MTAAERRIYTALKAGQRVTPAMTVATISTLAELDAYRKGMTENGALTSDAMAAIRDRQDELRKGLA